MSSVLGIDLSSRAVDLVLLDETTSRATWHKIDLGTGTALERLRRVPRVMPRASFYDDNGIYLVAIESPYGRGQAGTIAKLSRVFGAVAATIPANLETWEVTPGQWRAELGLPGNAAKDQCALAVMGLWDAPPNAEGETQDTFDAFAVAWYARQVNQRGIAA